MWPGKVQCDYVVWNNFKKIKTQSTVNHSTERRTTYYEVLPTLPQSFGYLMLNFSGPYEEVANPADVHTRVAENSDIV